MAWFKLDKVGGLIMKKTVEIIGLPVVSILTGDEMGKVRELLINATTRTVAALVVDEGKWYLGAKLLPYQHIAGLGEYAVTIDNKDHLISAAAAPEMESILIANVKIVGSKVLTRSGRITGKISEIFVGDKGKIISCEMKDVSGEIVEIPDRRIITYGKEVTIIAETDEEISVATIKELAVTKDTTFVPASSDAAVEEDVVDGTQSLTDEIVPETSANNLNEKHRRYLLGKKAARRIETDNGMIIVEKGGEITEEVLQKAKLAGKYVELSMSIQ